MPREYYIRRLCGRMFAVHLYRDTWGRLLAEICVDKFSVCVCACVCECVCVSVCV